MRWNHPVCDPCSSALRATHALARGAPGGRVQFCGWCAQRTDSGLLVARCDPAGVPYPDNPDAARALVARYRHSMAGSPALVARGRTLRLDRLTDADAVYVAGELRRIARRIAARFHRRRTAPGARPTA